MLRSRPAASIEPPRRSACALSWRCSAASCSASSRARSGDPLIWTDELSRFLMVWVAVFGWMLASRRRIHIRIRYFQDLLPARAHAAAEIVIQLCDRAVRRAAPWYGVGLVAQATMTWRRCRCRSRMAWMYVPMALPGSSLPCRAHARSSRRCASCASTRPTGAAGRMTHLMVEIVVVWLRRILAGVPLFASMGLAAFAFVGFGGLSAHRAAEDGAGDELVSDRRRAAVHPDGQHPGRGRHHRADLRALRPRCVGWLRGGYAHASILLEHDLRRHGRARRSRMRPASARSRSRRCDGGYRPGNSGRDHGGRRHHRADHSAEPADGDLRRHAPTSRSAACSSPASFRAC